MDKNSGNIYKIARKAAGLTQERWAEQIGISPDTVRLYEGGRMCPSDEVAARMAEIAMMPVLCYWHIKHKSGIANDILPEVPRVPLAQAVLNLLAAMDEAAPQIAELMMIARDGKVTGDEVEPFDGIVEDLDDVVQAALAVKYAERTAEGGGEAFIAFAVLAGVLAALTVIANAQSAAELILLGVIIMAYIVYGILWLVGVI